MADDGGAAGEEQRLRNIPLSALTFAGRHPRSSGSRLRPVVTISVRAVVELHRQPPVGRVPDCRQVLIHQGDNLTRHGPHTRYLFIDHSQIVQLEALRRGIWGTSSLRAESPSLFHQYE
jgi:hypothetical protein